MYEITCEVVKSLALITSVGSVIAIGLTLVYCLIAIMIEDILR